MSFADLYLVNPKLDTATTSEIAAVEKSLGLKLPKWYAEFVRRFGSGVLCGRIRVYHPRTLEKDCKEFRERVAEYYFWKESPDVLSKQQVTESVPHRRHVRWGRSDISSERSQDVLPASP